MTVTTETTTRVTEDIARGSLTVAGPLGDCVTERSTCLVLILIGAPGRNGGWAKGDDNWGCG